MFKNSMVLMGLGVTPVFRTHTKINAMTKVEFIKDDFLCFIALQSEYY